MDSRGRGHDGYSDTLRLKYTTPAGDCCHSCGRRVLSRRVRGRSVYFPVRTFSRFDLAFSSLGRCTWKMPFDQDTAASSA